MQPALQVFYDEFGALMMRQPLFGLGFTTYAPLALLPYMACPPRRSLCLVKKSCCPAACWAR